MIGAVIIGAILILLAIYHGMLWEIHLVGPYSIKNFRKAYYHKRYAIIYIILFIFHVFISQGIYG